jgi:hypothetical protein
MLDLNTIAAEGTCNVAMPQWILVLNKRDPTFFAKFY